MNSSDILNSPSYHSIFLKTGIWYASYTLVAYDYVCSFDTEVLYVWSCPWSIGVVLFYMNRYLPFVDIILFLLGHWASMITPEQCLWFFPLTLWVLTLGVIVPQIIIVLRTHALWGCSPLILWVLVPLSLITFSALMSFLSWKTYVDVSEIRSLLSDQKLPPKIGCQISALSFNRQAKLSILCYNLTIFTSEAVLSILTIKKAQEHLSQTSDLWVNQLYKNGILYCFYMLVATTMNMIMLIFAPVGALSLLLDNYKALFLTSQRCLTSVFANRIMLIILKNRQARLPESNGQPSTDIFTSVYLDTRSDSGQGDLELSTTTWQMRAHQEWIR